LLALGDSFLLNREMTVPDLRDEVAAADGHEQEQEHDSQALMIAPMMMKQIMQSLRERGRRALHR